MFVGRVGTGFCEKLLASIDAQLQELRRATCPYNLPEIKRQTDLGLPLQYETLPMG
jgi:hypothetical protein